ncbi:MAG: hypothetical protein K2O14_08765 [Oscillospiraceae bacterium]|nr:hypothetical protein [Oscillospiraceae bacterium]
MKHTFIREKSLSRHNCRYKEIDWFEYSEEEQQAVRNTRRTKTRASPPKIKKLNNEYSRKYFRWLLFNNFDKDDYHLTLTFEEEFPRDKARRELTNYIQRLRRYYKKHGVQMKYMYVTEDKRSGSRLHYHIVLSGGVPRDEIENRWHCGWANADRLKPDKKDGLFGLSKYLTKSKKHCDKFERSWNCSTNLKRPDIVTDDNRISKKRMRKLQNAKRNDEVKEEVEKLYKGWVLIDSEVDRNEVTGRPYVRLRLIKRE